MNLVKKVVISGHFGVGKTSLVSRFVHQKFSDQYLTTIGVKVDKKEVALDDQLVTMMLWDIAGEANLHKVSRTYLMGAHGLLYCFDLTREETFARLEDDLFDLTKDLGDIPVIVIGNKRDLIDDTHLTAIKAPLSMPILATSARTGEGVAATFVDMASRLL